MTTLISTAPWPRRPFVAEHCGQLNSARNSTDSDKFAPLKFTGSPPHAKYHPAASHRTTSQGESAGNLRPCDFELPLMRGMRLVRTRLTDRAGITCVFCRGLDGVVDRCKIFGDCLPVIVP